MKSGNPEPALQPSVHRATLSSMAGLVAIAGLVLVTAGGLGLRLRSTALLALACAPALLLALARVRLRLSLDRDSVCFRGMLAQTRIPYADVRSAVWAAQRGWWPSRVFGPHVYEIRSAESRMRINLKLFASEAARELLQRVPPR